MYTSSGFIHNYLSNRLKNKITTFEIRNLKKLHRLEFQTAFENLRFDDDDFETNLNYNQIVNENNFEINFQKS